MKKSLAVVSILFVFQVAFLCAQEFEVPTSYDAPATVSGGQGQSHAPAGTVEEKLEVPNKKELPANVCVEGLHCGWYGGVPNVDPICCDRSCEEC
ncbi:MAG: hypothetical protein KDD62_12805, partial [Bdellovibrionales bacterium]|nr:hypothetical protein [Bdellovibrionales bacterium]